MKKYYVCLLLALLPVWSATLCAQKARSKAKAKTAQRAPAVTETPGQKLYKTMLPATAKVMFVDSVVVPKADFLAHIPVDEQIARLTMKAGVGDDNGAMQYENGFGDRRLYASGDSVNAALYSQVLLGDGWSEPQRLAEFDGEDYGAQNFPFLCSDGLTLFFSATGPHSIGGRDIFMTTKDTDKGKWYDAQNYGLPFNSPANEYLLVIDDTDSLGWLVSDRNQHEDSVCVYTFVPMSRRLDFSDEDISAGLLKNYADIHSIADTWGLGDRAKAIGRRNQMLKRRRKTDVAQGFSLVIDDDKTIRSADELTSGESRQLFGRLQELHEQVRQTEAALERNRQNYAAAAPTAKSEMAASILRLENDLADRQADITMLEKRIRRQEAEK